MSIIADKIDQIKFIGKIYDSCIDEFNGKEILIKKKLNLLLDEFGQDFNLTSKNSVRSIKYYTITTRVKEVNSLEEKLIRNNDLNAFKYIFDTFRPPQLNNQIKDILFEIDDIIGLKILTDLNVDTYNMFQLIKSQKFLDQATSVGFTFNEQDMSKQPTEMKNGLWIYKIKCQYRADRFELQIKSKLESSWADMEHAIFYKDYRATPVRSLAQASMNHVGKLLLKIDDFLFDIRRANENFESNSEIILFMNEFEKKYSQKVSECLQSIAFDFTKISNIAYFISENGTGLKPDRFDTEYQKLSSHKYANYVALRNINFELQIFEAIILNSFTDKIDDTNLDLLLERLFEETIAAHIKTNSLRGTIQDEEVLHHYIKLIIENNLIYNGQGYILDIDNIENMLKLFIDINDALDSEDADSEIIDQIRIMFTIDLFSGNLDDFIDNIENNDQIKSLIEKIKGFVSNKYIDSNKNPDSDKFFSKVKKSINSLIEKLD